ncbi:hypothetical protein CEXT_655211 [Caerostris extrusa]|uniref:Uncharacterized protein n=1 Tax=Caerostris extrusa TaxID=172846 RepID=A0AAV4R1A7_CAEEX|nr:hypothetical protein CEXT_655211 [Caerostris extrusa]
MGFWTASHHSQGRQHKDRAIYRKAKQLECHLLQINSAAGHIKNASTDPMTRALKAYKDGDMSMPQKYLRKFRSLQQEIYRDHPELKPRIGGAFSTIGADPNARVQKRKLCFPA